MAGVVTWIMPGERERVAPHDGLELVEADLFENASWEGVVAARLPAGAPRSGRRQSGGRLPAAGTRVHETHRCEDFERMLALNLRPTFLVTRAARRTSSGGRRRHRLRLRARGAAAVPGGGRLRVLQGGGDRLREGVAAEYRDEGVRCNAILPSVIDTPANRAASPTPTTRAGCRRPRSRR